MAKHDNDAVWQTIDPSSLEGAQMAAYERYREARRVAGALKAEFEQAMQVDVPGGSRMIFGYNFGKLSVAIVADDRKPPKAKGTQSLAEFLAQQRAGGSRL